MDSRPWPCFVLAEARKMPNLSEQTPSHAVGRDSQTELLRIVAMVMILILHANFLGVGAPEHVDFLEDAPRAWGQMVLESLCIVAIDVFVLISGWYGIRFRKRRLAGFLFQVWFFTFVLYFVSLLFDRDLPPTPRYVGHLVVMDPYWFARSYLLLYLLSPVLNKTIGYLHHRVPRWGQGTPLLAVIALYALVQSIWGWYGNSRLWGDEGDSVLTFVFLYFVGRWLRLYSKRSTRLPRWVYAMAYLVLCVAIAFMGGMAILHNDSSGCFFWYKNTSLPVIAAAIALFLLFRSFSFHNSIVNKVAASCFAVYLFNCSPSFFKIYKVLSAYVFPAQPLSHILEFGILLLSSYFLAAILLDRLRIFLWNKIEENLCSKL